MCQNRKITAPNKNRDVNLFRLGVGATLAAIFSAWRRAKPDVLSHPIPANAGDVRCRCSRGCNRPAAIKQQPHAVRAIAPSHVWCRSPPGPVAAGVAQVGMCSEQSAEFIGTVLLHGVRMALTARSTAIGRSRLGRKSQAGDDRLAAVGRAGEDSFAGNLVDMGLCAPARKAVVARACGLGLSEL